MKRLQLFPIITTIKNNSLTIAGHDLTKLAKDHGTPLYLYDRETMNSAVADYKSALTSFYPAPATITYAGKAFLNLAIAQWTQFHGLLVDCTGEGETAIAVAGGVPREHILAHGVNKSRTDLESALKYAGTIVVDNLTELHTLESDILLSKMRKQAPALQIWIRLLPGVTVQTHHAHTQTGQHDSKFGMTRSEIIEAAQFCKTHNLPLNGIHFHQGSNFRDASPLKAAIELGLDLAAEIGFADSWHFSPGGGWGVAYHEDELPQPDANEYVRVIAENIIEGCKKHGLSLPHLHLEPGRSLVARAGVAVYRVGAIKRRGKKVWILTDGGMTDNPRHAMYGARYSCLAVSNPGRENKEKVSIAGPYCESGDVIIEDLPMPKLEIGELIAIPASGAYHLSMSSNYNGSRKPAVLLLDEGQARLIQRRETIEDLLRRDRGFYLFPKKSKDDKGMENRLQLLEVTTSAFQELLSPIIGLTSSYEILKGKTSPDIEWNIFVIGEFGEKLKREVENIYHDIQNEFDLRSPSKTASRIRQLASTWKKQLLTLSVAIRQIQELRELGHRLDDPELDAILGESLINAFTQLEEVLDHLETIEGPDLTSWRPA